MIANNSSTPTRVVTAHLPNELVVHLDEVAQRIERSKAWVIKEALISWIELEEKRHKLTLEAIADTDSGKIVSHKEIESWLSGLGSQ